MVTNPSESETQKKKKQEYNYNHDNKPNQTKLKWKDPKESQRIENNLDTVAREIITPPR